MNAFLYLFKHRTTQLKDEADIDLKIKELIDICPNTIAKYYLSRREQNRQQYFETLSSNMFNLHKKSLQNLEEIDNHHKELLKILNSGNACKLLS